MLFTTAAAQTSRLTGTVVTDRFEPVPGANLQIVTSVGQMDSVTDPDGKFSTDINGQLVSVAVSGDGIVPVTRRFSYGDRTEGLRIRVTYLIPAIAETVTIRADSLGPQIEYRNAAIYDHSLFSRDDQLIQTLNAGINAGQHEGGGKSLEIRRYGFNLDHGGVGGGLKILVDNVQQNQGTQGHGQGYLGALKSLSPELIEDVSIINGPFSAAYGDFSGLGVVQIRQKESLPQVFTARVQTGSFNTYRGFFALSPSWKDTEAFIAYEPGYTDGPFRNKLRYRRDNLTGNLTYTIGKGQAIGLKVNVGRNSFSSSGQLPLDLVATGELDRFGFIDPDNGGRVSLGTAAGYFRKEFASGATFKADVFLGRSLFDLFSNFTFALADPIYGDEVQQHDSRLQEGANAQYMRPYELFGQHSMLTAGANFHASQINVGLYPSVSRNPNRKFLPGNIDNANVLLTSARAKVINYAGYAQNEINLLRGRLRIEAGLRFDVFTYDVSGFELSDARLELGGKHSESKLQPKLALALSPFEKIPITFYANYGRGISSQDARGVIRQPSAPKLATTDFYQVGTSYNGGRVSTVISSFLIDRSNEQVYIPDDGSIEVAGPTRSYGIELRNSVRITRQLSLNGGLTRVIKAFYRDEFVSDGSRRIIDSAPHLVANGGLVVSELQGFNLSLSWRHIASYRLNPDDRAIRASGHDVVDLAVSKHLRKWVDLSFSIDNLLNKRYFETQNLFESRPSGTSAQISRIHATPGYPRTIMIGATFMLGRKN